MKECYKCNTLYPEAEFTKDKRNKDGLGSYCKFCNNGIQKEYKKTDKAKVRLKARKVKLFSLTLEEFYRLSHEQLTCAICKNDFKSSKDKHLDHCHITGKARAFLCTNCNLGLGHFKDKASLLIKASNYIKSYKEIS